MNIFHFILSFTFLLIISIAGLQWKMMLIYGEPVDSSDSQVFQSSWEQCYSSCYGINDCWIAYYSSAGCQHFEFVDLEIRKLNSSENKLVGIKRFLGTEECPKRELSPLVVDTAGSVSDKWTINNTLYNVTIFSNGSTVTISRRVYECDTGSKLFQRDSVYVCIGLRFFSSPSCANHSEAVSLCQKDRWLTITGPRGLDEFNYLISLKETARYGTLNSLIWVDGNGVNMTDDTIGGQDQYPKCNGFGPSLCKYIGQGDCDKVTVARCYMKQAQEDCWRGAACRRELDIIL
ncbi:hypothetical protein CRE_14014 [Caenorhabditis remanei]|uniref:PAN-3 domain-containing protein n=1 Tax=Caenorhabditis remanei TaxID=31234 RepID=E3M8T6_CAERE|nr:hypothetical protein CRE_14014 [Caenorhabditis remanei]